MTIRVLFFGASHDITGFEEERLELVPGTALDDLRRRYEARFPRLGEMGAALLTAVNQELRERSWPLADGDEVAFLPPVSGGHEAAESVRSAVALARIAPLAVIPAEAGIQPIGSKLDPRLRGGDHNNDSHLPVWDRG